MENNEKDFCGSDLPQLVCEKYDDIPEDVVKAISAVMMTILYKS